MNFDQIKQLMVQAGFRPNKRLGQNFLIDSNIRRKMLDELKVDERTTVLEIGPGFGSLTFEIAERALKVIAVEKDDRVSDIVAPLFEEKGNIELIRGDVLEVDLRSLLPENEKVVVFGNIPYYVTTPIIEKMIGLRRQVSRVYLLTQEEYADRLISGPGSKVFGSISCYVQFYCDVRKYFKVKSTSFYPRPKVESTFIGLEFLDSGRVEVVNEELFLNLSDRPFRKEGKR